jgi:hypothetical protein
MQVPKTSNAIKRLFLKENNEKGINSDLESPIVNHQKKSPVKMSSRNLSFSNSLTYNDTFKHV